jgi:protein involved in polysaccharide export with SLBB domain
MRVSDLIDTAGGLMKSAYLKTAELTRRHISQSGMETEKIDIDLEKAMAWDSEHNILLQDYDHLIVRPIPGVELDRVATISGEVRFPGVYPVQKGEALSSLLERAGGFTERAYLKGAFFTRESAKAVQQDRMDRLIKQLEESMLTKAEQTISINAADTEAAKAQQISLETKKELITKLRAAKIDGRVVIKLVPLEQFKSSKYDLELERSDSLVVPETPNIVTVIGEVFNTTALLYEKDRTVGYYLGRVGGMTKEADKKEVSVIKADGSVISMAQRGSQGVSWDSESHRWFFGGFLNVRLDPGDTIIVPRKMDKYLWMRTTRDITQILFQIALTAGVVLAL